MTRKKTSKRLKNLTQHPEVDAGRQQQVRGGTVSLVHETKHAATTPPKPPLGTSSSTNTRTPPSFHP